MWGGEGGGERKEEGEGERREERGGRRVRGAHPWLLLTAWCDPTTDSPGEPAAEVDSRFPMTSESDWGWAQHLNLNALPVILLPTDI